MSYKFIYFDLDDTLLDHQSAEAAGLKDVHTHFDLFDDVSSQELIDVYHEVNRKQWSLYSQAKVSRKELQRNRFELTLKEFGLNESRYEEVGTFYMQAYRNHWKWMDGAKEAYYNIIEKYPAGILTNGFAETQRKKFEAFDLYNSAHTTVISEEVGVLKPHPDVFAHATEKSGVDRDEILYVGDSLNSDVKGGTDFGWNVAWFTQNGEAEKHQIADFVFDDFMDLKNLLKV
ncbi:HAD-IA family hydrolase [Fodinibius sp.]|uniref:HAD family hydrolase n=1 Tax=Fodinibius sp. TaxID=1872440 RepID=UPI002ACE09A4|nr:HAD-IA family hydrolase [Fodinibius sp.]MDZ7657823.1 HAD-IA family hydrolase [Fodinibius sp.]